MRTEPVAGDGSGGSAASAADAAAGADAGVDESGPKADRVDPELEAVLEELRGTNVNEEPPIKLMAKVQEWQERLDEEV